MLLKITNCCFYPTVRGRGLALYFWLLFLLSIGSSVSAQTVIFSAGGRTYTNTKGTTSDTYTADVSTCTSIRITMDFNFSVPWEGPGNMESADECPFGVPPCLGNPNDPLQPACVNCWDFLWAQFTLGGLPVGDVLIGGAGTTDADQSGTISSGELCTEGATSAEITVVTQTWASNESVTFSNIVVMCWQGTPIVTTNDPVCSNGTLNLIGSAVDPSAVSSWSWSNSGTGIIADPSSQVTSASTPENGETYILTTTDVNGCTAEASTTVTIINAPVLDDPGPFDGCVPYPLPAITGSNLSSPLYYTGPNGTGTSYAPGQNIPPTVTTLYIFDDAGSGCFSEVLVPVTINTTPVLVNPGDPVICGTYLLGPISGSNLVNPTYYTGPGGTGMTLSPGEVISTSQVIYIYDAAGSCIAEEAFTVTITPAPLIDDAGTIVDCDTAYLPALTGVNLTGGESYYSGPLRTGNPIAPFTAFTRDTLIYAFDGTYPSCFSETLVFIEVVARPEIDMPDTISVCDTFFLPTITGNDLSSAVGYFTETNGQGVSIPVGNPITTDTTIYIYDEPPSLASCFDNKALVIRFDDPPALDAPSDLSTCDSVELPVITGTDLTTNVAYFSEPNGQGTRYDAGTFIDTAITLYLYDSVANCIDQDSLEVLIIPEPQIDAPVNNTACDTFFLLPITGTNLSPTVAYFDQPNGAGNQLSAGDTITGTTTLYIYDSNGSCSDEEMVQISIVAAPEAGDPNTIAICEGSVIDLTTALSGADAGGAFADDDATTQLTGSSFNSTGLTGSYNFTYTVTGTMPCPDDQTIITVNVVSAVDAGTNATEEICVGQTIDLSTVLNGADSGGMFADDDATGNLTGNSFNSTGLTAGTYNFTYTVGDGQTCPQDQAVISIEVNALPMINQPMDLVGCDSVLLPAIAGTNLSINAAYYDSPNGAGVSYAPGSYYKNSGTLYIYDNNNNCEGEVNFNITINTPPNGGADNRVSVCTGATLDLSTALAGADAGGTFADDDGTGNLTGASFNTTGLTAGEYRFTYTVLGTNPCPNAQSVITVEVVNAVSAGLNNSLSVCEGAVVDLFANLDGGDLGGTFNDDNGTGGLTAGSFNTTGLTAGTYNFTYTVGDGQTCPQDQAVIQVEVLPVPTINQPMDLVGCDSVLLPPIAGSDVSINAAYFDAPNGGGTTYAPGSYYKNSGPLYIFDNNNGCEAEVNFTVTINESVNAGSDAMVSVCIGSTVNLLTALTGADTGGTFADDDGSGGLSGATFNTAGLSAGMYRFTYTVSGTMPCPDAQALVTVELVNAVSAGLNNSIRVCSGSIVDLFANLDGGDLGGTFNDDNGTGGLTAGSFNTTGLTAGTYNFTYTVGDGQACPQDQAVIQVEILPLPMINQPMDLVGCDSVLLPPIAGSNVSINVAYFDAPNGGGTSYAPGSYYKNSGLLYVFDNNNGCEAEVNFTVTINESANAGSDAMVSVCIGSTVNLLTALTGADTGGIFADDDGSGGLSGATFNTAGLSAGTYRFTYTVNGTMPCPDAQAVVTVELVNAVSAGLNNSVSVCSGSIVDLFANLDGGDLGGTFNDDNGTGGLTAGSFNTTGLTAGTYNFTYTVGDGQTCPQDQAVIQVEILPLPVINQPMDLVGCDSVLLPPIAGSDISLNAAYYDAPNGGGTSYAPGSYYKNSGLLYVFDNNNGCEAEVNFTVTINESANAGSDAMVSVCIGSTVNLLTALTGADTGGTFADDDGSGGLSGATFNTAGLSAGTYRFTYTVNGTMPCPDAQAVVTVELVTAVSAGLNNSLSVCSGSIVDLFANLDGGDLGGTFNDDDGTGSLTGGSFNTTGLTAGTYNFTYTIGDGQTCPQDQAVIQVEILPLPVINQPMDLVGCDSVLLPAIGGSNVSINAAYYDAPNGGGTSYAPGSYYKNSGLLYVFDNNNGCEGEVSFTVTINEAANAGADAMVSVCIGSNVDLLTALTGADTGGTFADDDASGGLSGTTFNTAGLSAGTYRFTYTVNGTMPCPDAQALVTVELVTAVSAGLNNSLSVCEGSVVDLFGNLDGGDLGGTFNDDDGTGALTGGSFNTTGLTAGTYNFTYTVGDGQTCPQDQAVIQVEVLPLPVINQPMDLVGCDSVLLPAIGGSNVSINVAYFDAPNGGGTSYAPGSYYKNNGPLYIFDSNNSCEAEVDFTVTINESVDAGADAMVSVCVGSTVDLLTALTGADAGGVFADDDASGGLTGTSFNTTGLSTGTYRFTYTVSGTMPCPDAQAVVTVELVTAVSAGLNNSLSVCEGSVVDLFANLDGGDLGGTFNDDNGTGGLTGGSFNTTGLTAGTYNFTYTIGDGQTCPQDQAVISVEVNTAPILNQPMDLVGCDSVLLPPIAGSNVSINASYYDQPNGAGTAYAPGTYYKNNGTLYIYDSNNGCDAEVNFAITINGPAYAGEDGVVSVCISSAFDLLTALPGADAGGTFTDDDASGGLTGTILNTIGLTAGTYRFTYTLTGTAPCPGDQSLVTVELVSAVTAGQDNLVPVCQGEVVDLSVNLNGGDLGGTFADDDGTGALTGSSFNTAGLGIGRYNFTYTVGDGKACPKEEALITVEINATPVLDQPIDVVACDSILLPAIAGSNLSGNASYFDQPNGGGMAYLPGTYYKDNGTLYIYDSNNGCDAEVSFGITINQSPNAGMDVTVFACIGSSIDLLSALSGEDAGGSFSDDDASGAISGVTVNTTGLIAGTYRFTYTVLGTSPCPIDQAVVTVEVVDAVTAGFDNGLTVCEGTIVDLFANLDGGDLGGTFTDDSGSGALTGGSFNTTGLTAGTYEFTYLIGDGQTCPMDDALISVTVNAFPQLDDPGLVEVCNYYVLPQISGTNIQSALYYDQPNGNGQVLNPGDTIRTDATIYLYALNGSCEGEASLEVRILEVPTVDDVVIECDASNGTYVVRFSINGGDAATYQVSGEPGILTNGEFVSQPILLTSSYAFFIEDGNACSVVEVMGDPDCGCESDAGTLTPPDLRVCEDGTAVFTHSNASLDADDVLIFILHDGDATTVGTILATNGIPEFGFVNGMSYGRTYYVLAIVGNSDGAGGIDLNDFCASTSNPVAVVFDPMITGSLIGSTTICEGESTALTFQLEGGSTYDITYEVNGQPQSLTNIQDGHVITVNPTSNTDYVLIDVRVPGSACNAQLPTNSVSIQVNQLALGIQVTSDYNGFGVSCAEAEDGTLLAEGIGNGSSFSYEWNTGQTGPLLENVGIGNYQVTVTDDNACSTTSSIDLLGPDRMDVSVFAEAPLCFGESNGAIIIDTVIGSAGPFEYSLDGVIFTALPEFPFTVPAIAAGSYEVFVQDLNDCMASSTVAVLDPPPPIVEVGNARLLTLGEELRVNLNYNFAPTSILWVVDGDIKIDCDTCLNPVIMANTAGSLEVIMTDANGCVATDKVDINLDKTRNVYIPNVFSPNGDAKNDQFMPLVDLSQVERIQEFRIYNRWGEVVFAVADVPPNDLLYAWDGTFKGKELNPAVFVYYAKILFVDEVEEEFKGDVTLVR